MQLWRGKKKRITELIVFSHEMTSFLHFLRQITEKPHFFITVVEVVSLFYYINEETLVRVTQASLVGQRST